MIEVHAAIPDLDDLVHGDIQEIAVVRNQHEGVRVDWRDIAPASCGLPDRGDWWARRAAAGWVFRAAAWPARCASASRRRTLRCACSNPHAEIPGRRAPCPPAPRWRSRRACGIRFPGDGSGRPPARIRGRRGRARAILCVRSSISASISWSDAKTDMHSAKTVRPESDRPSCGR